MAIESKVSKVLQVLQETLNNLHLGFQVVAWEFRTTTPAALHQSPVIMDGYLMIFRSFESQSYQSCFFFVLCMVNSAIKQSKQNIFRATVMATASALAISSAEGITALSSIIWQYHPMTAVQPEVIVILSWFSFFAALRSLHLPFLTFESVGEGEVLINLLGEPQEKKKRKKLVFGPAGGPPPSPWFGPKKTEKISMFILHFRLF